MRGDITKPMVLRWVLVYLLSACACAEATRHRLSARAIVSSNQAVTTERANPNPRLFGHEYIVSDYCSSILSQFLRTYASTRLATSLAPWYEGYGETDSNGLLTGSVTSQSYWTSTITYTEFGIRAYTAKPPCCSACYMTAGTIDFFFWPDQATTTAPPVSSPSSIVDEKGFTFVSPSVYMAFSSLVASNKCGQVGDLWTDTTIAFDPDEITTARPTTTLGMISSAYVYNGNTFYSMISALTTQPAPRKIHYPDLGQNCSTLPGYIYWPDNPTNADAANWMHDPCHPVILLPPRLLSMQDAWIASGCGPAPGTSGAYDPPHVLTQATAAATATAQWYPTGTMNTVAPPASPRVSPSSLPEKTQALLATTTPSASQPSSGARIISPRMSCLFLTAFAVVYTIYV